MKSEIDLTKYGNVEAQDWRAFNGVVYYYYPTQSEPFGFVARDLCDDWANAIADVPKLLAKYRELEAERDGLAARLSDLMDNWENRARRHEHTHPKVASAYISCAMNLGGVLATVENDMEDSAQ